MRTDHLTRSLTSRVRVMAKVVGRVGLIQTSKLECETIIEMNVRVANLQSIFLAFVCTAEKHF